MEEYKNIQRYEKQKIKFDGLRRRAIRDVKEKIKGAVLSVIKDANRCEVELDMFCDGTFTLTLYNVSNRNMRKSEYTATEITFKELQDLIDLFEAKDVGLPENMGYKTNVKVIKSEWLMRE